MSVIVADVYSGDHVDLATYRRAGRKLIIRKATEGVGFIDPGYPGFVAEAHRLGIVVMHYHFARPDLHPNPGPEVAFLSHEVHPLLGKRDGIIVDWEVENHSMTHEETHTYLAGYHSGVRHFCGRDVIGYANLDFLSRYGSAASDAIRRWWVADYGPDPGKPGGIKIRWAWQYTNGETGPLPHTVPGLSRGDLSRMPWSRYHWITRGARRTK